MTTIYTPAELTAMPERALDALAAEIVMGQRVEVIQANNTVFHIVANVGTLPNYSTSLDDAALLEAELLRHGLNYQYVAAMGDAYYDANKAPIPPIFAVTANAKLRTIAAILAVQSEGK